MSNCRSVSSFIVAVAIALQMCNSAKAVCISPPAPQALLDQIRSDTNNLLADPNLDVRRLEQVARDVAATDASLAGRLVALAREARPDFRGAIAAGLAQAALACLTPEPGSAQLIQQAVATFPNAEFQALFAAVSGDLSTAAIEAAASSATSGFGSVVIVNPNRGAGSATPTPQGSRTQTTTGGVFAVAGPNLSSAGATAASPVSPTQ